jgi:hypothetical protein
VTTPIAGPFPTGFSDDFSGAALDPARWPTINGASVANGRLLVNASFAGGPVYSSARSSLDSLAGKTWVFRTPVLPAGDANAQMWVMDNAPAGVVDRVGFEYVGIADRMDFIAQTGTYAPLGTTISVPAWSSVGHTYFRLQHTGASLVWSTSPDGATWTTRRTLAQAPAWTSGADCRISFEAFRNTAGTNDTLQIDSVNLLPSGALPTTPPTPADALQKRTIDELASWRSWLQGNGAAGFVGEFGVVTKWADFGDAAQQAKWDALADVYLSYADYAGIHTAYWSSGREFDAQYTLGLHVPTTVGGPLSVTHGTSTTVAAHPSRQGVIRAVNLSGHEAGIVIGGGGTVRTSAPLLHTAADFAYIAARGVDTVRLPLAWERLQPTLGAALDPAALTALDGMLTAARQNGIDVLLDLHNYGRYTRADGTVVALGGALTNAQLADFWTRLSTWVRADAARSGTVTGYGLMNEPHALTGGASTWQAASQDALTALRNGGDARLVLVGGYSFSSLTDWRMWHPVGWIDDPADNFAYEAHHYFDTKTVGADGAAAPRSGQYQQSNGSGGRSTLTYATELAAAQATSAATVLPVIRGTYSDSASSGESATLLTGAETRVGDVLIAWQAMDWETASLMTPPTGTGAGTWTELHPSSLSDLGANAPHLKAWWRRATANGAQRVTVPAQNNSDVALVVVVLDGTTVAEGGLWIDAATGTKNAGYSTSHTVPSVNMTGDRDRLLVAVASGLNSSTAAGINYTSISPLSKLREIDSAAWITLAVGTIGFTGTGGSGVRGFTSSVSRYWVGAVVAVRGAVAANPIIVNVAPVAVHLTAADGVEIVASGQTRDLVPLRQRLTEQRIQTTREVDAAVPVAVRHERQRLIVDRGVNLSPLRVGLTLQQPTITNLSVTPLRIRVGIIASAQTELVSITPLTDRTKRPVAQTYVRPRKNLRYLVQEVLSRKWVSWDFPLREPDLTWNINAANEIVGKVDAREVADLDIDEWSHYLHVEQNGEIRNSGIILPWAPGGPELTINAAGVTRYPHGQPYQGSFPLGNPPGVNIDPLDVVRHIWSHLQSYADGKLGVIVAPTTSPVRIGEPPRDVEFTTGAGEEVAFTAGPYLLKWYEETDCGAEIDDLAKETPFDFREAPRWNEAKDDVIQYVEIGFPRLGRDQRLLAFAQGENLIEALAPVEDDERYASEVITLGKGEGTARVRGRASTRIPRRVRRSTIVEVKNADSTARADALAFDDLSRRHGLLEVNEVNLLGTHPNAPFGSFAAGDDIPVRMTVDGYGHVIIRHRVEGFTFRPEVSELKARTKRSDSFTYRGAEVSSGGATAPTTPAPAPPAQAVKPPTSTAPPSSTGIVPAAKELLARAQSGAVYYEDFTYPGCSANLSRYNDELVDRWVRAHGNADAWGPTFIAFLQKIIAEG